MLLSAVIILTGVGCVYWLSSRGYPHVEVRNRQHLDAAFSAARARLLEDWSSAQTEQWRLREVNARFGEFVMDLDCACGQDACRVTVVESPYGMDAEAYAPAPSFSRTYTICP